MREIKFRGKRIDNKEWVCGDIVFHYENQRKFILCDQMAYTYTECGIGRIVSEHYFEVIPETIGQYTGLKDKNAIEIYEGDKIFDEHREYWGYVEFDEGCFHAVLENVCYKLFEVQDEIQVIGNIYEDEEL